MVRMTARLAVVVGAAALALSGCSSSDPQAGSNSTQSGSPTSTQSKASTDPESAAPSASASADLDSKAARRDVTLGAVTVGQKGGEPSAKVTITNHSSKKSNYIVDVSLVSADGKTQLDAAMVSAEGVAPGQTMKRAAQFTTAQTLPKGAKITIVGVARLGA